MARAKPRYTAGGGNTMGDHYQRTRALRRTLRTRRKKAIAAYKAKK